MPPPPLAKGAGAILRQRLLTQSRPTGGSSSIPNSRGRAGGALSHSFGWESKFICLISRRNLGRETLAKACKNYVRVLSDGVSEFLTSKGGGALQVFGFLQQCLERVWGDAQGCGGSQEGCMDLIPVLEGSSSSSE